MRLSAISCWSWQVVAHGHRPAPRRASGCRPSSPVASVWPSISKKTPRFSALTSGAMASSIIVLASSLISARLTGKRDLVVGERHGVDAACPWRPSPRPAALLMAGRGRALGLGDAGLRCLSTASMRTSFCLTRCWVFSTSRGDVVHLLVDLAHLALHVRTSWRSRRRPAQRPRQRHDRAFSLETSFEIAAGEGLPDGHV